MSSLSQAIRLAALVAISGYAMPPMACADAKPAQAARIQWEIPAGQLEAALIKFSVKSGINIKVVPELLTLVKTSGVVGSYFPEEALAILLQDSGLKADIDPESKGVYKISSVTQGKDAELGRVVVIGNSAIDYSESRTSTATRTAMDSTDLAQSVTILTGEDLKRHQVTSIAAALDGVAGVSLQNTNATTSIKMRGLPASIVVDGLSEGDASYWGVGVSGLQRPIASLERLEVLSGADAIIAGIGAGDADSGVINVATKRPQKYPVRELSMNVGANARKEVALDIGDAFNSDRTMLYRVVLDRSQSDSSAAGFSHDNKQSYFLGTAAYWSGKDKYVWGIEANNVRTVPGRSVVVTFDGRVQEFPTPGNKDNYLRNNSANTFLEIQKELASDWKLQAKLKRSASRGDGRFTQISPEGDVSALDDNIYTFVTQGTRSKMTTTVADVSASRTYSSDTWKSTLMLGGTYQYMRLLSGTRYAYAMGGTDYAFPEPAVPEITLALYKTTDKSLFIQNHFQWNDWSLTSSVTRNIQDVKQVTYNYVAPTQTGTNPSIGVLYALNSNYSIYANTKKTFSPQPYTLQDGSISKPLIIRGKEVGLKYSLNDSKLSGTLSVYDTIRSNELARSDYGYYYNAPDIQSRGLDFNISGKFTKRFSGYFSYNYVKLVQSQFPVARYIPPHTAKVLATYDASRGDGYKLLLTGGVAAKSAYNLPLSGYRLDADYNMTTVYNSYRMPNQFVWEAGFTWGKDKWQVGLTSKNVTGKQYYAIGSQVAMPVESGRQIMASLSVGW